MTKVLRIVLLRHKSVLSSGLYGLEEIFLMADAMIREESIGTDTPARLEPVILSEEELTAREFEPDVIIIPPSMNRYSPPEASEPLIRSLREYHSRGVLLCTVCAGIFLLIPTGILEGREVTTHWALAESFEAACPGAELNTDKILINGGDLITAGGLMSWLDLALELVGQFASLRIMRRLGKILIVDTGSREQRYYRSFYPRRNHGDEGILEVQNHIRDHLDGNMSVGELAEFCALGERTFLRRFKAATGHNPVDYLQRSRIQRACELLESSRDTVQEIAFRTGYGDLSAFRKVFIRIIGLTPREFRRRFSS